MNLSTLFVPIWAYVQGLDRSPAPEPEIVYQQLQEQIGTARDQALTQEVSLQRFHEALFPVVAWVDERLSLLPQWHTTKAWRSHMLQRKLFSTSLAGVQFFERLQEIDPKDDDLREVYVTCLALGFVGRYSQNPNSPELVALRLENYQLLRPGFVVGRHGDSTHLFPEAYRLVTNVKAHRTWRLNSTIGRALVFIVPLGVFLALAFWFDRMLGEQVADIIRGLS